MQPAESKKTVYLVAGMSMVVCSLNSGSNGNCYYVESQNEAVLIDAGLSCRETVKRLKRVGRSIEKVKAIFVSHEHGDHVHGISTLSRKYLIPVYITPATLQNSSIEIDHERVVSLRAYDPVNIGGLRVTAFPKLHDACDPHSFIVECAGVCIGVFTDIGTPCAHVIRNFGICHAAFLEANYDSEMLNRGRYPIHLKNRIRGDRGHLSNDQALELFAIHRSPFMSHLFLAHLSRDNNSPELVRSAFNQIAAGTEIVVASRDKETSLYPISDKGNIVLPVVRRSKAAPAQQQLSLF